MDEEREQSQSEIKTKAVAEEEFKRIKSLLENQEVSEVRIMMLIPVIENTAWMKAKLDDAREQIRGSSIVVPYNNGGGQKGLRENPLFKGYENLWRCYVAGMSKILEAIPPEIAKAEMKKEEPEAPATILDLVRDRHKKEA